MNPKLREERLIANQVASQFAYPPDDSSILTHLSVSGKPYWMDSTAERIGFSDKGEPHSVLSCAVVGF